MIDVKDFSTRERFPGREGNSFDVIMRKAMALENFPIALFFAILALISFAGYPVNRWNCLWILPFFLFDWISIRLLPKYKRSYGPIYPQVFVLAICRMLPEIFFVPMVWVPLEFFGCVLQIYAFWIEPYQVIVTQEKFETDKIPSSVHFKVLHMGDLHLERKCIREERLSHIIREISPDVILFSGDYLCLSSVHDKQSWADLHSVLNEWIAPLGIFGVTGSPAVDIPENFPGLLEGSSVQLLQDRAVFLEKGGARIQVIGLGCTHKPHEDYSRLQPLLNDADHSFRILLHHSPDIAPMLTDGCVDLQLSGHTHGGQVCLPVVGPLFTGSLYGLKFKSGKYKLGRLILYIVRGLGLEGLSAPRARFLCPPEIVLWDITGKG